MDARNMRTGTLRVARRTEDVRAQRRAVARRDWHVVLEHDGRRPAV